MGNGFGADCLPGAWRTGEVEGECEPGRMALAEPPAVEDEIVLRHLRQRRVERASRRRRQNDVVEGPARGDRLDGAASGRAEQTGEWNRRHASTVPPLGRTIKSRDDIP